MTLENGLWKYTVPGQIAGTSLDVTVTVYDEAGNTNAVTFVKEWNILSALVNIDPNPLNLESLGTWVTAYLELPEGYDENDIDASTVYLNGTIQASGKPTTYDQGLMVKFKRTLLINEILGLGINDGEVIVTVTGELKGTIITFVGSDTIRVNE
jgi:hypothetical protein